jgi:hypothetical protein
MAGSSGIEETSCALTRSSSSAWSSYVVSITIRFLDGWRIIMAKRLFASCATTFLLLWCTGCNMAATQPVEHEYPPVLPIWIVEDDPNTTVYSRKDLERDRKAGKMLVIPLYRYFQQDGATEFLAIAHPFVYEQGEDIEKHLSSFEQRKNLRRLIFWVPGFFPDGLGRTPSWTPIINGKRVIVVELQRCVGSEENEINAAMKTLLLNGDFTVGKKVFLKPPPPPYGPAKMSTDSYDASKVVRSEYMGRYFNHESPENTHILWAFLPGTQIINRLNDEEKKTVAAFFAEVTKKAAQRSSNNDKATHEKVTTPHKTVQTNKRPSPPANAGPRN